MMGMPWKRIAREKAIQAVDDYIRETFLPFLKSKLAQKTKGITLSNRIIRNLDEFPQDEGLSIFSSLFIAEQVLSHTAGNTLTKESSIIHTSIQDPVLYDQINALKSIGH